ncbi:BtrH N-terminal domain-containing protein [Ardenticatena maritima]|uniref:BtrH N-terminal domain-containing protein n=1 Tax=Ardenticatena maritima TaxID=872965 RepID=UPI0006C8C9F7|nr:BtrH N-terminal domain-containing protein [Ardenticatena maritima]
MVKTQPRTPKPNTLLPLPHAVGVHCSSTSVRDVLAYDGVHLSEAMVFGLGSGLGFVLWPDPDQPPALRFNGRARDLEGKFYANVGAPLTWARRWDPHAMREALERGRPLLAQTDIQPLPYYDGVHFAGHGVVIVGLDVEANTAWLADVIADEPQPVPLDALQRAMGPNPSPLTEAYHWAPAPRVHLHMGAPLIRRAVRVVVEEMLAPDTPEAVGLPAMRRYIAALPESRHAPNPQWVARFAYQTIEKRGTGGGAFRLLYAQFLREAAAWVPALAALAEEAEAIGRRWQALAQIFKRTFIENDWDGFTQAAEALAAIADAEEAWLARLAEAVEVEGVSRR